jgi:hypothetical protein
LVKGGLFDYGRTKFGLAVCYASLHKLHGMDITLYLRSEILSWLVKAGLEDGNLLWTRVFEHQLLSLQGDQHQGAFRQVKTLHVVQQGGEGPLSSHFRFIADL